MENVSKHDEYVEDIKKKGWCPYVDSESKIVGVYSTPEDMRLANKSKYLKKLTGTYKYKIQMVIK